MRTSRYLDGILKVNQELVATRSLVSPPLPSDVKRPNSAHTIRRSTRRRRRRGKTHGSCNRSARVGEQTWMLDISSAVTEVLKATGRGRDPLPLLQALYERIGFGALLKENGDGCFESFPTSPSAAKVCEPLNEANFSNQESDVSTDEWCSASSQTRHRRQNNGAQAGSTPSRHPVTRATGCRAPEKDGSEVASGICTSGKAVSQGYSFAHSPQTRSVSVAERSPNIVGRLEALASQLQVERMEVEQWYKKMVKGVSAAIRVARPLQPQRLDRPKI